MMAKVVGYLGFMVSLSVVDGLHRHCVKVSVHSLSIVPYLIVSNRVVLPYYEIDI